MSTASHSHLVLFVSIGVVIVCAVGLYFALRTRTKKIIVQDEDITQLIADRLSTGQFSREPSSFRRKAAGRDQLPETKKQSNG